MKLGEVYVEVSADTTKLTAGLNNAKKSVTVSTKAIGRSMAIAGAAIVAGFGMAIKTAAKFEKSMALTASVASATSEELKELSDYARKMGEQSVFSASQAADGMYYLASAGMNVNEVMGALEGTLALAAATQSDLAYTSESVASALSQYALDASEATRVANVYAAAISGSQATMEKLTTSMSYVGPMAKSMGMSIEDTTGILMGLYNAGIPASTAGTALRMAFVKLIEPTTKGAAALDGLKVSVVDSSGAMRPFKDIIDDLGEAGMTTADAMAIFGIRSGPAMMALVSQGTGAIQENVDAVTDTEKAYEMAAMQIDTFEGAMKLLRSAFEELQITLVQDLMPALKGMIEKVTEGIKKVSDWMKENPKLTATIVKITAGVGALMLVLGPLVMILPSLVTGFAILKTAIIAIGVVGSGPIGLFIIAIAGVVLGLKKWEEQSEKTKEANIRLKASLMTEKEIVNRIIAISQRIAFLRSQVEKFGESIFLAGDAMKKELKALEAELKVWTETLGDTTETGIKQVDEFATSFADKMLTIEAEVKKLEKTIGELLKSSEELSSQMKILTAEYELTGKTLGDTNKYYQNMLDVAEELVEVKEAEMDALEKGTSKWDEAYLAYLAAQKVVKDLKEAIVELNEAQKKITVSTETMAQATGKVYNKWYELAKLWAVRPDLQTYFKMSAEALAEYGKGVDEVTVAEEAMAQATGEVYNKWYELAKLWAVRPDLQTYFKMSAEELAEFGKVIGKVTVAEKTMAQATGKVYNKWYELAKLWDVRPDLQAYFGEAAKAAKELGDEVKETGKTWGDFFDDLKYKAQTTTEILQDAFLQWCQGIADAVGNVANSLLTMAETNAKIKEDMAEENENYLTEMEKLQEEYNRAVIAGDNKAAQNALDKMDDIKEKHEEVIEGMEGEQVTFQSIWETFWSDLKTAAINALVDVIAKQALSVLLTNPLLAIALLGLTFISWLAGWGSALGGEVKNIEKSLGGMVKMATGGITKFATGGMGTDTVPAMLTPGEYVISKPMVDFIKRTGAVTGNLVDAIRSGTRTPVPAFATGGGAGNPISSTYNQQRSYAINIQPGAINIVTPKFSGSDAKEMFRLIEREAKHRGLAFGRV